MLSAPLLYQHLYINLACLSVCLFVCLFVSNKRQNGWTDRAQIFCGSSRDPREGLWMIKFSKICLHQNSIFENFENPRIFFLKIREIFCFCYLLTRRTPVYFISNTNFYKWKSRKKGAKRPEFLVNLYLSKICLSPWN